MAYQGAKAKYREAVKGRGVDLDEMKKRNGERLSWQSSALTAVHARGEDIGIEILNAPFVMRTSRGKLQPQQVRTLTR